MKSKKGFTLVELCVTMAITSIAVIMIITFLGTMNFAAQKSGGTININSYNDKVRTEAARWITYFDTDAYHFECVSDAIYAVNNEQPEKRYAMYFQDGYFSTERPASAEPYLRTNRLELIDFYDYFYVTMQTNPRGEVLFCMNLAYNKAGRRVAHTDNKYYTWFLSTHVGRELTVETQNGGEQE